MLHLLWHWFLHWTGADNMSGWQYGLHSGLFGWVFPPLGLLLAYWFHHICHEHHCYRVARHPITGTPFRACKKHHPDIDHTKPLRLSEI